MLLGWLLVACAHGVWAGIPKDMRCVTAVYSAYNYISFAGIPPKPMWHSQCRNLLKVTSIYAASEIYCNEHERARGLAQLADQCQEFGHEELLSRGAVAENLTEDAIRTMRVVDYQELSRADPIDIPVLLSASYYNLMFDTIVRSLDPMEADCSRLTGHSRILGNLRPGRTMHLGKHLHFEVRSRTGH